MEQKSNGDVILLIGAFWLGYFIDNYEDKNTCPSYCAIHHEHITDDNKQRKNNKRNSKKAEE